MSLGYGINESGAVVGRSEAATGSRAFLWTPEAGMQNLGDLPGGRDMSTAFGINDSGHVVGVGWITLSAVHAFLWTPEAGMLDLGDLPGGSDSSRASDINNSGHIVGDGDGPSGPRAVLWSTPDDLHDLNTLLDASGAGWTLTGAVAINNAGQIVGFGTNPTGATHAFLLNPVPEPSTLSFAGCILTLLLLARCHSRGRRRLLAKLRLHVSAICANR